MMRGKWRWLLLFLVLHCSAYASGDKTLKTYFNQEYRCQFSYPNDWLPKNLQAENNYLAIYSPDALKYQEKTLELVSGIKVELYLDVNHDEIAETIKELALCYTLNNNRQTIGFYCLQGDNGYISYVPLTPHQQNFLFIAYIPEKDKLESYKPIYDQIVLSFSQDSNSSDR